MSSQPRASGYFRTSYGQDIALTQTKLQRISAVVFIVGVDRLSVHRLEFLSRSGHAGVSRLHRRAVADAADRLCRTDLARPCRPSLRRRLHRRHPVQGIQHADLADAARRRAGRRIARRDLRPAVAAACAVSISRSRRSRCISSSSISAANTKPSAASPPAFPSMRRSCSASRSMAARSGITSCSPSPH